MGGPQLPKYWVSWGPGTHRIGGAEFAGPENDGPKKIKDWKMQDLENDGTNRWKMTDHY